MKLAQIIRCLCLFFALCLTSFANCQKRTEISKCVTTVNNLYDLRELVPLSNGNSLQIRLKHGLGKSALVIEKLNDSLVIIDKRQIVLKGDFINFFTYDFKDIEVLVNDNYCYLFLCERNKEVLSLHSVALQVANLDDVCEMSIIAKMNKGKIYDTNIRQPFDGYFLAALDQYANIIITSVESREDVFKKKTSKKELEVKVSHAFFDCELNQIWETSESQTYFSEFEILPGVINSQGHYSFITKNSPAETSYKYDLNIITIDVNSGSLLNETEIISSKNRFINEISLFNSSKNTYLAGSYYRKNHKASSGIVIGNFDLAKRAEDPLVLAFNDYSNEEIIDASFFNASKVGKTLSKGKLAELPHFTIENVIELENSLTIIGHFISKKSSHHFRHQYFENFEGRNRDLSNNESLSGGTLGLFNFDKELKYQWGEFLCRKFNLPVGYMKTISLIGKDRFQLVFADNSSNSFKEKYKAENSKELSLFKLSVESAAESLLKVTSLSSSNDYSFMLESGKNSFRNNSVIFQTKSPSEDCIRVCRINF